ncbi:MAG: hypothetical protein VX294_08465 [Candidatus Latescibacterota bacterium]|nr:hypothetical protein [Candidatus Latescibacterota bacterium]
MNFRRHMVSGGVMGVGVVVGAVKLRYIAGTDYLTFCHFVGYYFIFSLFPDFDATSVPNRWFF